MNNFKWYFKAGLLLYFTLFLSVCTGVILDNMMCKKKAESYNLSYVYKFPSGCMIGIRK